MWCVWARSVMGMNRVEGVGEFGVGLETETSKSDGGELRCGVGGTDARHEIQGPDNTARDPTK